VIHVEGAIMAEYAAWMFIHGKRLRRKLKEAGAISEDTAKTISELGLSSREIRTLERNVVIGKVKEITNKTSNSLFYNV